MADKNIPDLSTLLAVNLVGGSVMEWYDATSSTNRKMTYTELATLFAPAAPFTDTNALVKGSSDTTKLMRFEVDGFTTGTTRVLTPPDSNITLAGIDINQTFTGVQTFTPAARSSGSASAFTFNTPADTGTTASTERIEFNVPGAIVTWATGALTTQRFNVFGADTVAFAGASTCTTAVGNEWASPVAGTNATLTKSIAGRFVGSVASHVPLVAMMAASPTGNAIEVQSSTGAVSFSVGPTAQVTMGSILSSNGTLDLNLNAASGTLYLQNQSVYVGSTHLSPVGDATSVDFGQSGRRIKTVYATQIQLLGNLTGTTCIIAKGAASATADALQIQNSSGTALFQIGAPAVQTTGSPTFITVTPPAHTTLTASTEAIDVNFNLARTVQFATGAIATQRAFVIQAPTYGFAGASTITTAVGLEVNSPSAGTNAVITSSYGIRAVASSAAHVPVVVKGASSQTGNLQEWQNSSGSILAKVSSSGQITGTGSFTLTGGGGIINAFNGGFTGAALNADAGNQLSFTGTSYTFTVGNTTGALNVKGAASRTVGVLNLQTSAGGSLGNVGGCIFDDFTDAASTHTDGTFDTLLTHTTVANTLAVNGDKVNFECTLSIVGHAVSTDQIKVSFAGITIFDSGAINYASNTIIKIRGSVMRKTSTTCRATVDFIPNSGTPLVQYTPDGTLTGLTLTSTNILAVTAAATGTNSASGDVTAVMNSIDVIPAGS